MFNILIRSKAQMKSFNTIGWNDYAQLRQNNPPEPGRCFPGIFFPWVFTKCHSFVLMEGQPPSFQNIRNSIELCIQVPQIEPNIPDGAQDLPSCYEIWCTSEAWREWGCPSKVLSEEVSTRRPNPTATCHPSTSSHGAEFAILPPQRATVTQ